MELNDLIIQKLTEAINESIDKLLWGDYKSNFYKSTFPIKQPDMYFDFTNIA